MPPDTGVRDFVFWGARGHALVLAEILAARGDRLLALFDNDPASVSVLPGVPLYHGEAGFLVWLANNQARNTAAAVAIGGAHGRDRCLLADRLSAAGLSLPALIHPGATVSQSASIDAGCHALAGAVIGAAARLGRGVIVNTHASVDHECVLNEGVHIAPGATLCGCVEVGAYSFVGPGAVVVPRIRIGRNVIIGAGAVVTRHLSDNVVAWGNPARIIKENQV